jgi:hypothetical protein
MALPSYASRHPRPVGIATARAILAVGHAADPLTSPKESRHHSRCSLGPTASRRPLNPQRTVIQGTSCSMQRITSSSRHAAIQRSDGIGFEEVVSAFEFHATDNAALPGAVRPPDDGQNGHALGGSSAEFAQHFVVPLPRCAGQIADLKSPAVWLFHNF